MSELQAGRELDALIAEKVMGFAHEQQLVLGDYHGIKAVLFLSPEQAAYRRKSEHDGYWQNWSPNGDEVIVSDCVPPYSTDIAAAWQLIEKAAEWEIELDEYGKFSAEIAFHVGNACISGYAEATTAPLAICLAALNVVAKESPASNTP